MNDEELKEQIQIDLCTFLELMGVEDNRILDGVCEIVISNFNKHKEQ
jgi:hypothetical protein